MSVLRKQLAVQHSAPLRRKPSREARGRHYLRGSGDGTARYCAELPSASQNPKESDDIVLAKHGFRPRGLHLPAWYYDRRSRP